MAKSINKVPVCLSQCVCMCVCLCVCVCSLNAANQQSFKQSACWVTIFQVLFIYYLETCKCSLNIQDLKLNPVWGCMPESGDTGLK